MTVNGKICHECEREPLSVSGPASIGYDSVLSGESPNVLDVLGTSETRPQFLRIVWGDLDVPNKP